MFAHSPQYRKQPTKIGRFVTIYTLWATNLALSRRGPSLALLSDAKRGIRQPVGSGVLAWRQRGSVVKGKMRRFYVARKGEEIVIAHIDEQGAVYLHEKGYELDMNKDAYAPPVAVK
jgi:hypothetical protein